MIGGDKFDRAVTERGPKFFTILTLANRGSALEFRRSVGDVLCNECEVVGTGLDAHHKAFGFRFLYEWNCIRGRQVHDVNPSANVTRQTH